MATSNQQFLKDPDQESRRAELTAFIGPNADAFLKAYDKTVAIANRKPGDKIKWSFFGNGMVVAAFFVGPVWYFYRKMWIWGIGIVALIAVLSFLPTNAFSLPLSLGLAVAGRQAYISHAIQKITALRQASTQPVVASTVESGQAALPQLGPAFLEQLRQAGGVCQRAAWIGGVLYALLIVLAIFGIWYSVKTGQPLPR